MIFLRKPIEEAARVAAEAGHPITAHGCKSPTDPRIVVWTETYRQRIAELERESTCAESAA
ncbi:hypothetical protein C7W93_15300 [Glaciimonas sp. PCH181]|nr:hypothetical protein C7W93_15300 [Glaciimonas sp. PCH181]